jgi:Fur family ferric uptake transcriptional regulator
MLLLRKFVTNMSHNRLDYAYTCARGFRVTRSADDPRRDLRQPRHARQVWARVHAGAPALNRATVYRTLEFLRGMRLIVALELDGVTHYEIAGETPHHHLVCRTCGKVSALPHALLANLSAQVRRRAGFTVDTDHVVLHGQCAACSRKARRAPRKKE